MKNQNLDRTIGFTFGAFIPLLMALLMVLLVITTVRGHYSQVTSGAVSNTRGTRISSVNSDHHLPFLAPVGDYGTEVVLTDGWTWEALTNQSPFPHMRVLINSGQSDQRVVEVGNGRRWINAGKVHTIRFESLEDHPIEGEVQETPPR